MLVKVLELAEKERKLARERSEHELLKRADERGQERVKELATVEFRLRAFLT